MQIVNAINLINMIIVHSSNFFYLMVILPMNTELFVQNIKRYCALRGVKPTVACRESGAGTNLINMLERRGSIPSVEKVQLLAQYLGVTVGELLGERPPEIPSFPEHPDLVLCYDRLSKASQLEVMAFIEFKARLEEEEKAKQEKK